MTTITDHSAATVHERVDTLGWDDLGGQLDSRGF
ncbi:MAG: hypothetical protein QOJ85_2302, partial [Solirubrobacteraceae bacterium]|nr:hypothetical protein [Solirubrobacteraceae bacterium]